MRPVIGIKVTTIKAKDGQCPRGSQGCGVCSSLEGDFCITEEIDSDCDKDTARLLAAGANRVFWLRAMKAQHSECVLLRIVWAKAVIKVAVRKRNFSGNKNG